ncbi:MAG: glycoside hydrolase family 24 [Alphaproteobacteria bacterium 64-6]|nr:DUF2460 domain-containing protein [Hyphomicrobium sp.]OJU23470.1 MAG: glycoside hydrolase family 24 [Alphaproteobacteria bacterium 64-6]
MSFHEIRFPTAISRGATGGPERRTDVVALGSGHEERNSRWADSRRSYNAGYGVKTLDDLHAVIAFFEERRGRLYGFRWKDHADFRSCPPSIAPSALDQPIGVGDGETSTFQLCKRYGSTHAPWSRRIAKPVVGSILVAVDGEPLIVDTHVTVDPTTGTLTFAPEHIPAEGAVITAGFEFDVPVRFDTDKLEVSLQGFSHGAIPSIPIVEVRL